MPQAARETPPGRIPTEEHREQHELQPGSGGDATDLTSLSDVICRVTRELNNPRLSTRASFKRLSELPRGPYGFVVASGALSGRIAVCSLLLQMNLVVVCGARAVWHIAYFRAWRLPFGSVRLFWYSTAFGMINRAYTSL